MTFPSATIREVERENTPQGKEGQLWAFVSSLPTCRTDRELIARGWGGRQHADRNSGKPGENGEALTDPDSRSLAVSWTKAVTLL